MMELLQAERLGYVFSLEGDAIRFVHTGTAPDATTVQRLFAAIKADRGEAVHYLMLRKEKQDLEQKVNQGTDQLVGMDQHAPGYDALFEQWEAQLRRYEAICDELSARSWHSVTVILPADSLVPTIAGKWERQKDGRIRATYTRRELAAALSFHNHVIEKGEALPTNCQTI